MINIYYEGRKNPKQVAEQIKSMIGALDLSLESVGDMTSEIWSNLYEAEISIRNVIQLLNADGSK